MIALHDKLPGFTATNQDGNNISSSQFLGKKFVMFFFPKADTPGCTAEACDLGTHYEKLQAAGYEILGVSADPVKKQKKFHDKFAFPYDLICDESKEICELFGVWKLKKFMGREYMGIERKTFIFDESGICTHIIEKVDTKKAAEQVLGVN